MDENYFNELLNHLSSEQKDYLYSLLEDFKDGQPLNTKAKVLVKALLINIGDS